nr:SMR family transporter [uncultured Campylobacter sp.]
MFFIIIGALFECDRSHEFKRASSAHERLLTIIWVTASFFIFMLALKYVGAALAYVLYKGLGTLVSLYSKQSSR